MAIDLAARNKFALPLSMVLLLLSVQKIYAPPWTFPRRSLISIETLRTWATPIWSYLHYKYEVYTARPTARFVPHNEAQIPKHRFPHPSTHLGNINTTESVRKIRLLGMSSMHGGQDHFQSWLQFEQHTVLTLALECMIKLLTQESSNSCFWYDATHDAPTQASTYINSDDAAGYALAW